MKGWAVNFHLFRLATKKIINLVKLSPNYIIDFVSNENLTQRQTCTAVTTLEVIRGEADFEMKYANSARPK